MAYTKVFFSSLDSMERIIPWILEHLPNQDIEQKDRFKLELALEELIVNIYEHAYKKEPFPIYILLEKKQKGLFCEIRDVGPEFDLVASETAKPLQEQGQITVGGHGIRLIKAALKNIRYSYENKMNVLRFEM